MPHIPSSQADRTAEDILADIVAISGLPGAPNADMVDWVKTYLQAHGVDVQVFPGPEGDRANLFATIGPGDVPGCVLSGHMDVVPVEGQVWTTDPFRLTDMDGRLTGRGAVDMKGFLACVLSMVPAFKAARLERPIHVAFSYDEEIGCRGVPHLIRKIPELCAQPDLCIVGEPTDMKPVLSHKGKQALELVFTGKPAHSSNPAQGTNAIYPAAELLLFIRELAGDVERTGPFDHRFTPPHSTLVAGVVHGGTAVNIIPEICSVKLEARAVPGQSPQDLTAVVLDKMSEIADKARERGQDVRAAHCELSSYPALAPTDDADLIARMERLSGHASVASVSYGTEAGLFQEAGIPAIVCGPGSISRAHRPDEYILGSELAACRAMLGALLEHQCLA